MAANPFYDNIRQNMELSQGISEKIPLTLPTVVRERIDELPFPWLRHIARRAGPAPKEYMPKLRTRVSDSSTSSMSSEEVSHSDSDALQNVHPSKGEKLIDEGAEALAMQFYRIELGEQRRLMGIMQHHSQESGNVIHSSSSDDNDEKKAADKARVKAAKASRDALFPYSITAGVEKGAKNRYVYSRVHPTSVLIFVSDIVTSGLLNMPESSCTDILSRTMTTSMQALFSHWALADDTSPPRDH